MLNCFTEGRLSLLCGLARVLLIFQRNRNASQPVNS